MKVSDESTIVKNDGTTTKTPAPAPIEKTNKKGSFWQGVLVGGIPGIMLGSAGTVFAAQTPVNEKEISAEEVNQEVKEEVAEPVVEEENPSVVENEAPVNEANIPEIGDTVQVASNVNDGMSFSEAFASARAEVGPGGVFVWNGNVYSTYYEEEWDNMTDEQKEEFSDALHNTASSETETSSTPEYANNYHETSNAQGGVQVVSDEVVKTDDGQEVRVTGVVVDGHYGEVYDYDNDGQADVAIIDANDDGAPDVAMVDENGDGYISENEVYSMTDSGMIAMNDPNPENALYDGMPDYTNDADTSSFA